MNQDWVDGACPAYVYAFELRRINSETQTGDGVGNWQFAVGKNFIAAFAVKQDLH